MNDVRRLLKSKEYIEKMMQRADPLMRLVMQRRLDVVCGEIEEARKEWHKGERGAGMNKERHYSAEHGYDDAISVVGDGDCKLASFSRPQNSQEEEWFAYGSDEDADAIANLAVNMRDELRNCIVEMDKLKQRVVELEASNEELLELLEFCCYRTTPGADCWCQHGQGQVNLGHCSEESYCPVWQSIQKARGQG